MGFSSSTDTKCANQVNQLNVHHQLMHMQGNNFIQVEDAKRMRGMPKGHELRQ